MKTTAALRTFTLTLSAFGTLMLCTPSSTPAAVPIPKPAAEELLSKELAPGRTLVITREEFNVKNLTGLETTLLGHDAHNPPAAVSCIRAELHAEGSPAVLLASTIESEFPDFRKGFNVVHVFTNTDEIVVACTVGDAVGLWRISLNLHRHLRDGWVWFFPRIKQPVPEPFAPDEAVIQMTPLETGSPTQRWNLKITDKGTKGWPNARYEQTKKEWQFTLATDQNPPAKPLDIRSQSATAPATSDQIIFQKSLDPARQIIVLRSPDLDPTYLKSILPDTTLKAAGAKGLDEIKDPPGIATAPLKAIFPVRVELHIKDKPPILLASRIASENDVGGFDVLDAIANDGHVVLALGENGGLRLWEITDGGTSKLSNFLAGWATVAKVVRIDPKTVKAELKITPEKTPEIAITDHRGTGSLVQHSRFAPDPKDNLFKRIERWTERKM